jgi:hypothetical protein
MPFKRSVVRRTVADPFADDPSPAAIKSAEDDDPLSLFRRSDQILPKALEEKEELRRKKQAERKRKSDAEEESSRKRLSGGVGEDNGDLRTTRQDADGEELEEISQPSRLQDADDVRTTRSRTTPPPTGPHRLRVSPRTFSKAPTRVRSESPPVIPDADDPFADESLWLNNRDKESDSDVEIVEGPKNQEPDEFEHYIREAREREAARQAAAAAAAAQARSPSSETGGDAFVAAKLNDPSVLILIQSKIPKAVDVMVRRKLSQTLMVVIETWATQQRIKGIGLPKEQLDRVFLTWKGNKIYSTTTLESLGLKLDGDGQVSSTLGSRTEGASPNGSVQAQIVLQMWTDELYQAYLSKKERERQRLLGELDDDDSLDGGDSGRETEEENARGEKIRVVLKARDLEPTKLVIYGTTPISIVEQAFRTKNEIDPQKKITLRFDGEDLHIK